MVKKKGGKLKYEYAPDLQARMEEIIAVLGMKHIKAGRVRCLRSQGSSSKYTIARCHTLGKLMQHAMETKAFYAIEFLELFERQSRADQDKTIIHELMHIPKTFGGGFRHHDYVCERNVEIMHEKLENFRLKNSEVVEKKEFEVELEPKKFGWEKTKRLSRWF